jgi:twinkle protein
MKIISLNTKQIYEILVSKSGENMIICPECTSTRKKQNHKDLKWNNIKMVGHCFHCETSFVEYKPFQSKKTYTLPESINNTNLSDKAVKYLEGRMISKKTMNKMKLFSKNEFMPQFQKEVETICFPYFYNEKLVNIKFRGAEKSFKLSKDAELIFYNLDCLNTYNEIIIVEGEIDCLSFIEIGFENCISVPAGGGAKEMLFLDNYFELFENKTFVLATDNDIRGVGLKDELIRRFGAERCKVVNFQDCKDGNEVLTTKSGNALRDIVLNAREVPISGIVNLNDYYDDIYQLYVNGLQPGKTIGVKEIDDLITWETSRLAIWTGIPGHGKSEVMDWFNVLLNIKYGWKIGYFSPENFPLKYHYSKIASKLHGQPFKNGFFSQTDFEEVFSYIENNYFFVNPEDQFTIETILNRATYLVKKYGIKVFCIDPYNKLDHRRNKNETETEYVSRFLDILSNFAKKNDVLVNLIAHPRKMEKNPAKIYECPNLYEINGSANFYNKADYGISIYRNFVDNIVEFHFIKIKFRHLGQGGTVSMKYNEKNGRYEIFDKPELLYNNGSYLKISEENNIEIHDNDPFLTFETISEAPF